MFSDILLALMLTRLALGQLYCFVSHVVAMFYVYCLQIWRCLQSNSCSMSETDLQCFCCLFKGDSIVLLWCLWTEKYTNHSAMVCSSAGKWEEELLESVLYVKPRLGEFTGHGGSTSWIMGIWRWEEWTCIIFEIIDKESQMATLVFDRSCALKIT